LWNCSNFQNSLILKDVEDDDEDNEDDDSKESNASDESKSESESEESEEDGGTLKWLPKVSGTSFLTYSKSNKEFTYTNNSPNWSTSVVGSVTDKYAVKLLTGNHASHFGFCPPNINPNASNNYSNCGWSVMPGSGTLYSQNGDSGKGYTSKSNDANTTWGAKYDKKKGTITFYVNSVSLGVAFSNVKEKKASCLFYSKCKWTKS